MQWSFFSVSPEHWRCEASSDVESFLNVGCFDKKLIRMSVSTLDESSMFLFFLFPPF